MSDARGVSPLAHLHFVAPFGVVMRALRRGSGWTQLQLALELHRDHTALSRWETGVLLPEAGDVARMADVLRLPGGERLMLHSAWARSSACQPPGSSQDLVVSVEAAATLRRLGHPRVAYELAARDSRVALHQARTQRMTEPQLREVLVVTGRLLLEEVKSALDFVPRAQVRGGLLAVNGSEHALVRDAIGDRPARLRWELGHEAVLYNSGCVADAHVRALALMDELALSEAEWLAETIRAVAINSAMVGDSGALRRAWHRFCDVEAELPSDLRRFVREGFVRGYAPVDPDLAFEIVDGANRAMDAEAEPSAVRRVQLARAEGQLVTRVSGGIADDVTRRRLEKALETSRRLELSKYVIELDALLSVN